MSRPVDKRPTRRRTQRSPLALGVLVVVAVVLATYFGFAKRLPFSPRWTMRGVFSSASQLRKGAPVRIAGVDVGKVIALQRGPGTTALVTMDIQAKGRPIHADALLRVHPRLFLEGGFFVELAPGSPSAPTLDSGHTIPLSQTSVPVQFFSALSALNEDTRTSLASTVHQVAIGFGGGGSQGLRAAFAELGPALKDTAIVAQAAQGTRPDDVSHVIHASFGIAATLAAHDASLSGLLSSYSKVTGTLAQKDLQLAGTLRGADQTLRAMPPALAALDRALPPLRRIAVDARPALRAAPPVLRGATAMLSQLDALVQPAELPALLGVLQPLASSLPSLYARLEVLFPRVTPVVSCVGNQALSVLNAKLDDGQLSTGRPVWQDLLHVMVGFAGDSQDFDGNGPWLRYPGFSGSQLISTVSSPGIAPLFGSASSSTLGARPLWAGPGGGPAFRPDVPCTSQPVPNLQAAGGPGARAVNGAATPRTVTHETLLRTARHPTLRGR
ncbi:MAG: MlaD family protein [Solirubrobacteraceae bacterium]